MVNCEWGMGNMTMDSGGKELHGVGARVTRCMKNSEKLCERSLVNRVTRSWSTEPHGVIKNSEKLCEMCL